MSLTSDVWADEQTNSYISVTAHYIDTKWHPKSHLLVCVPINERHTGVALSNRLLDFARRFSIEKSESCASIDIASSAKWQVLLSALQVILVYDLSLKKMNPMLSMT